MDDQPLACVYCGEPIFGDAVNILGGTMHPDCASNFVLEWESHRQMVEDGDDNE